MKHINPKLLSLLTATLILSSFISCKKNAIYKSSMSADVNGINWNSKTILAKRIQNTGANQPAGTFLQILGTAQDSSQIGLSLYNITDTGDIALAFGGYNGGIYQAAGNSSIANRGVVHITTYNQGVVKGTFALAFDTLDIENGSFDVEINP